MVCWCHTGEFRPCGCIFARRVDLWKHPAFIRPLAYSIARSIAYAINELKSADQETLTHSHGHFYPQQQHVHSAYDKSPAHHQQLNHSIHSPQKVVIPHAVRTMVWYDDWLLAFDAICFTQDVLSRVDIINLLISVYIQPQCPEYFNQSDEITDLVERMKVRSFVLYCIVLRSIVF